MTRDSGSFLDGKHALGRGLAALNPLRYSLGSHATRGSQRSLATNLLNRGLKGAAARQGIHDQNYQATAYKLSSVASLIHKTESATLGDCIRSGFMNDLKQLLRDAIEQSGLSKAEVARRVGVTPQSVTGWLETGRISKESIVRFAQVTGVHVTKLIGGQQNTEQESGIASVKVPLVSWVQAGKKNTVSDPHPPGAPEEWEEATVSVSRETFALRVRGDSMVAPDGTGFPEGSIIIVDPAIEAKNGDYVVVRFQDSDEATFKRLVVDGPLKILKPLNPTYPVIHVTEDARLAGVVVEFVQRRRIR